MTAMFIYSVAGVIGGWAMLSLLGGERERRSLELPPPPPPAPQPTPPAQKGTAPPAAPAKPVSPRQSVR